MKYPVGKALVENTFKGWTIGYPVWYVEGLRGNLYVLRNNLGEEITYTELALDQTMHLLSDHDAAHADLDKFRIIDPAPHPLATQVGGSHYKNLAIQPAEFVMANNIPWAEGNAIKYIVRHRSKGHGKEDLEKAKHYIDMIIARDYPTPPLKKDI